MTVTGTAGTAGAVAVVGELEDDTTGAPEEAATVAAGVGTRAIVEGTCMMIPGFCST